MAAVLGGTPAFRNNINNIKYVYIYKNFMNYFFSDCKRNYNF